MTGNVEVHSPISETGSIVYRGARNRPIFICGEAFSIDRGEYLKYDYWAKEVTPSNDLRKWFHADVENRWGAFADMYQKELKESDAAKAVIDKIKAYSKVTLLYASKEQERNHANVLKHYLDTHL